MLVRCGAVVTEGGVQEETDVLVEDGVIKAVGRGLAESGEVIDARDHYVLPGVIDPHVHTSLQGVSLNEPMLDDLEEASRTAVIGGATTICAYAQRIPGVDVLDVVNRQIEFGRQAAFADFAINTLCFGGDDVANVVDVATRRLGVRTFKAMLAYHKRGLMLDDDALYEMMKTAAAVGAKVLIHAENGRVIDCIEHHIRDEGAVERHHLLESAPAELEAEGIYKAAMLSRITGAQVLFVHLTSQVGRDTLTWLKSRPGGERLSIETQPHYALLTNQAVLERGALAKVGPVLKGDDDRDAVREALASGLVSHLSSDHSPRSMEVKLHASNIFDAPYGGISGTEVLLPLAWKLGLHDGLFEISRLAQLTSTNAAKQYGLYPKKGAIRPGADADLVLVPIEGKRKNITPSNLHMRSDYSLYEGIESAGFPAFVIKGGRLVVGEGDLLTRPHGAYLGAN